MTRPRTFAVSELIKQYSSNQIVRIITAGNSKGGKSTTIKRLIHDATDKIDDGGLELNEDATVADGGLPSIKNSNWTHRFLSTVKRKFIFYDAPHTKTEITHLVHGASISNLALLVIDVEQGINNEIKEQLLLCSTLRISHIIVCLNKMDLVGYDESVFNNISGAFRRICLRLDLYDIQFIPISAKLAQNITVRSIHMSWYNGPVLQQLLESIQLQSFFNFIDPRLPVQFPLIESDGSESTRFLAGYVGSGTFRLGDRIIVLPSGMNATIRKIICGDFEIEEAYAPIPVVVQLSNYLSIKRGDLLAKRTNLPSESSSVDVTVCWFSLKAGQIGLLLNIHHYTRQIKGVLVSIHFKIDKITFEKITSPEPIFQGDLASIRIEFDRAIYFDPHWKNRVTGSLLLIDPNSKETVAASIISDQS